MDGVRDMYLREGTHVTDTPTFEGLRDMMETPAGYHKSDQEEDSGTHSEEDTDVNEVSVRAAADAGRTTRSGASAKPRDKGDMSRPTTTRVVNVIADTVVPNSDQEQRQPGQLEVLKDRSTQASTGITAEVEEVSGTMAQSTAREGQIPRAKPRLLRGRKQ
ncbi:hypothetical protein SERLA73DRAFT_189630, partial [Serpula lacrymans var. lacrymans S7.3]